MEADFSGWATKTGLKCSDGRTIMPGAFEHMDQETVPLVYQHGHSSIDNVLGHTVLEYRKEGVRANAFFNGTPNGQAAKEMVEHGDLKYLSIYANQLQQKGPNVTHGMIREVSLVLAGANPGAVIDQVNIRHSDGSLFELEDEVKITTGIEIELSHSDDGDETDEGDNTNPDEDPADEGASEGGDVAHAASSDMTVQDVIDTMTEDQKNAMYFVVGRAVDDATANAQHSDNPSDDDLTHKEGADDMSRNVFDQDAANKEDKKDVLSHEDIKGIFADAVRCGSLKMAAQRYVDSLQHGIDNIDVLFPDSKMATGTIDLDKRRTEWVSSVLNGVRTTPFSRIKTFVADLTQDEARAKGYITGNYKEEEWFGVTKRTTGPTTIYKKQKLDRDDMLDITDFDIVAFLKAEMRLMLEEEFARAVLIGDGRNVADEDKIKDPMGAAQGDGLRSIINDHELFVTTVLVNVDDSNSSYEEVIDASMDAMEFYKGSGTPTFFTTIPQLNMFMKARDLNGRRYYETRQQVADALGVSSIVTVEPMKEISDLIGIIVNLDDYNVGTDRGGEITMFDDFDIDYNQQKYLLETRSSGALVHPKSAIVLRKAPAASVKLPNPTKPAFDANTGVVTIPTVANVTYKNADTGATLTAGAQSALAAGASLNVVAVAAAGYFFSDNQQDDWTFTRKHA